MTMPPVFPDLPMLGFPLVKSPSFSTGNFTSSSGIMTSVIRRISILWDFTLTIDAVASDAAYPGLGVQSWQAMAGFFADLIGAYGIFLLQDPTDCTLTNQLIGTGDGTTLAFGVTRTLGQSYAEPVGWINAGDITSVSVGGTVVSASTYSVTAPNILTFAAGHAPADGAAVLITASRYYFQCKLPDSIDFEETLSNWWTVKELKLKSIVPNYPTLVIAA